MYIFYTNDSIVAGPNKEALEDVVADLKTSNLEVKVEGTLEDLSGVNNYRRKYVSIHLAQLHLIEQIVKYLGQENPKNSSKSTPA